MPPWFGRSRPSTRVLNQFAQGEDVWTAEFKTAPNGVAVGQGMHDRCGHVLDPHRLKTGVRTGQRHHRHPRLQPREQVDEGIVFAKDDARSQHGQWQPVHHLGLQGRFAMRLAALIKRGPVQIGAQRAHMDQPRHLRAHASLGQLAWQLHMQLVKRILVAMQHRHQIHHRVMAVHMGLQRHRVKHIRLHHCHQRQGLHRTRRQTPRQHRGLNASTVEGLANMPPHKPTSA